MWCTEGYDKAASSHSIRIFECFAATAGHVVWCLGCFLKGFTNSSLQFKALGALEGDILWRPLGARAWLKANYYQLFKAAKLSVHDCVKRDAIFLFVEAL